MKQSKKLIRLGACSILALIVIFALPAVAQESDFACNRTIKAQVVALDQPWMWNRLGAAQPGGIIYALYGDVVKSNGDELRDPWNLSPEDRVQLAKDLAGNVRLRDDKRARPLVLRANKGDCLEITFWNLLSSATNTETTANTGTTNARAFNLLARSSVQKENDTQTPLELKGSPLKLATRAFMPRGSNSSIPLKATLPGLEGTPTVWPRRVKYGSTNGMPPRRGPS
jgi:hypothetical protein